MASQPPDRSDSQHVKDGQPPQEEKEGELGKDATGKDEHEPKHPGENVKNIMF